MFAHDWLQIRRSVRRYSTAILILMTGTGGPVHSERSNGRGTNFPANWSHSLDIFDDFVTINLPFPTDISSIHALSSDHDPVFMQVPFAPSASSQGSVKTVSLRLVHLLVESKLWTSKLQTTKDVDSSYGGNKVCY